MNSINKRRKKKKRVHIEVIEFIKKEIEDGNLTPGNRLLSERQLAEKLQISRTSVKEAFVAMTASGIIEVKPNSGARLLNDKTNDIIIKINMIINNSPSNIVELMELRRVIESEACFLAATRSSKRDILNIEKALNNLDKAMNNNELASNEDLEFHLSIARASRNKLFYEVMNLLSLKILTSLSTHWEESLKKSRKNYETFEEHKAIFLAIKKGDAIAAKRAMNEHLDNVKAKYL